MSAVDSQQKLIEAAIRGERVEFPSRGGALLVGEVHRCGPAGGPWLLLCHGMESTRKGTKQAAIVERFVPLGYSVLRFDFSFLGESEGRFEDLTVSGEVADLRGALDFLAEFDPGDCTVIGSSLGGLVALLATVAAGAAVSRVATIAAVVDPAIFRAGLDERAIAEWRAAGTRPWGPDRLRVAFLDDLDRLGAPAVFTKLSVPILAMHGSADEVVPPDHARMIAEHATGPVEVEIFDGVGHRFEEPGALDALLDRLEVWLRERCGGGGDDRP